MTKQEILNVIEENITDEKWITFIERLDDGRYNEREMCTPKEDLIDIVTNLFDDDLHGHVRDGIMTTILGYFPIN
ncbi:MAG: hypothetical protein ABII85_00265 [Bacillota bacterium]